MGRKEGGQEWRRRWISISFGGAGSDYTAQLSTCQHGVARSWGDAREKGNGGMFIWFGLGEESGGFGFWFLVFGFWWQSGHEAMSGCTISSPSFAHLHFSSAFEFNSGDGIYDGERSHEHVEEGYLVSTSDSTWEEVRQRQRQRQRQKAKGEKTTTRSHFLVATTFHLRTTLDRFFFFFFFFSFPQGFRFELLPKPKYVDSLLDPANTLIISFFLSDIFSISLSRAVVYKR